ncbi:hypothetical protein BOW35_07810 [Solemya velum gill symbiont]|nr:hypothetical protein BOW29_04325 [Solemya velum gill symbiont]OOZ33938.1 hypothetical protein BOW35_07810 [Solemya velum gill symbiont]
MRMNKNRLISVSTLLLFLISSPVTAEVFKARLEWAHTVDLRVLESGVVDKVAVLEGQRVNSDALLLELDQRDFDLAISSARAALTKAEVELDHAQRKFDWNSELYDQGLISENEQHEGEIARLAAEASVAAAKSTLVQKKIAKERSKLTAPFDGILILVDSWKGQVILPNLQKDPLIRLASANEMVARARVSADRVGDFEPGQEAMISVGNQTRPGKIYRIGAVSEGILERGVAYAVDVIFSVADGERLRPGQFSKIDFSAGQ